jgi:tetratricopeptide (TPR) repeat protein
LKPADATAQALSFLNKALELDPESAEALAGIGLYHINRPTETAQSIEPLEKALGINPSLIDASNWLQIAYGSLGDNIMSKKILEEMVERDPMYPPGYSNLIQAYNLFGEQEKSQALLERIRPFLHGDSNLLLAEARTWQSAGRPSKSIPLLAEMLASQPKNGVARNLYGWDLIGTGQYEEALAIAREEAANGNIEMMIGQLSFQGKDQQLVEFVESRWPDLAALERDYPDEGDGHSMMLSVALAYARTGNDERFGDAMQRVRQAHDRAIQQGVVAVWFDEARYWALAGDSDRAMEFLGKSEQQGLVFTERLDAIFREFENLRGDDRFEALLARVFEHTNNERAELGLERIAI